MDEIVRFSGCFVCGDKNPHGLNARFFWDGTNAITETLAIEQFEGYKGIYHGGIISTLLDEVMVKAILATGRYAVTAEITVRFLEPVRTGVRFRCIGRIVQQRGRLFHTTGEAVGEDGTVYARAEARFLEGNAELGQALRDSLE